MRLIYILFLTLFYSCSQVTVDYHMPTSGGYTPETSGDFFSGNIGGQIHSDQKVEVGSAYSTTIFGSDDSATIDTTPEAKSSLGLGFYGILGVIENLDIGLKTNNEATTMFNLKYQFIGSSLKAREEGHKLSVAVAYGTGSETESNFQLNDTNTNSVQNDLEGEIELKNYELGLQYGYRFDKNFLLYNSLYFTEYDMEGSITSTTDGIFKLKNESWLTSANIGAVLTTSGEKAFFLQVEFGYSYSKTKGATPSKHDQANIFVSSGLAF